MHEYKPLHLTVALPGVEVVTLRDPSGQVVTTFHGGRLDGERFTSDVDADDAHQRACRLARIAAWSRGRR